MWHRRFDAKEVPEFIKDKAYSNRDLELMAELILRNDARTEMCRECNQFGTETGEVKVVEQNDKDGEEQLNLIFPEYICSKGHKWYKGEGKAKGTKGKHPILLEEHLVQRRRREIHSATGDVDPSIVSGIYWRAHPQGRPTNSIADRQARGLGYFR